MLLDRVTTARKWTNDLITDVEEAKWFDMPAGGIGHVAWQLGHLAASQVALVHMRCFGKKFTDVAPDSFRKTFGRGSEPVADRTKYPPLGEIRSEFDRIQADVLKLVSGLPDAALDEPAGAEPHPMFTTRCGAVGMVALHETFHAGQIAVLRRLFGKAPLR